MTTPVCPEACHDKVAANTEDIKNLYTMAIPGWVRVIVISLIGTLFVMVASAWDRAQTEFATKAELAQVRADTKQDAQDIKDKLDLILQKVK